MQRQTFSNLWHNVATLLEVSVTLGAIVIIVLVARHLILRLLGK